VLYHACVAGHPDVVALLLERGADPNDGESVFHAAELNRRECLALLAQHGASLSGRSEEYGNTPLYFVSGYHTADALLGIEWLLEHGADPNVTSAPSQETALHRAAVAGRRPLVERLLAHGADPGLARADGRTPYVLAKRGGHPEIVQLLAARGAAVSPLSPVDALISACAVGDEPAARRVLADHPGLVASLGPEDRQPLIQAVYDEREDAVRAMVGVGFDLAWEGVWGGTPLHHAAWLGQVGMTRLLISLDAPINPRDRQFGCSPIAWAAHGSHNHRIADDDYVAIVEALIEAGSERAPSYNRWGEPPEALGTPRVTALLEAWAKRSG
jgi:ankyrin repeat protein